jgi:hypothetical protein
MDRSPHRLLIMVVSLTALSAAIATQSGCSSGALFTALYLIKGNDTPAEFPGLKDKKVAVVCRPLVQLQYSSSNAANELAVQVGRLLKENLRRVQIVDPRQVAEWTDENTSEDYVDIGKAVEAECVLAIDLEQFNLHQGQTLYQGKAKVILKVYDVATKELLFQKTLPQTVFPPNAGIPTTDRQEDEFRAQFVAELANVIGCYFYPHDPGQNYARDSISLR